MRLFNNFITEEDIHSVMLPVHTALRGFVRSGGKNLKIFADPKIISRNTDFNLGLAHMRLGK